MTAWIIVGVIVAIMALVSLIGNSIFDNIEKKNYNKLTDKTKDKITMLLEKLGKKSTLTREFMDDNGILMILSNNIKHIDRKFYVLRDEKNKDYYFLDSKLSKVFIQRPNLELIKLMDTNYHYNEEKLVYTGVTVGGITTGGFHVEGGDYSKQQYSTGKYAISICIAHKEVENICINEIYLNSGLLEKAKESSLEKYIDGKSNRMSLQHELSQETQKNLSLAASSGDYSLDGVYKKMESIALAEVSLTKEECIEVKNWLLSNMPYKF